MSSLSDLNYNLGNSLLGVAVFIVLLRLIFSIITAGGGQEYMIIFRDLTIFVIGISVYPEVYSIVSKIPEFIAGSINLESPSFEVMLDKTYEKFGNGSLSFFSFSLEKEFFTTFRSFTIYLNKMIYSFIINVVLAFYVVLVFSFVILKLRSLGKWALIVVIFAGSYPILNTVIDHVLLLSISKSLSGNLAIGVSASFVGGAIIYAITPLASIFVSFIMSKSLILNLKSAAPLVRGFTGGARMAGRGFKKMSDQRSEQGKARWSAPPKSWNEKNAKKANKDKEKKSSAGKKDSPPKPNGTRSTKTKVKDTSLKIRFRRLKNEPKSHIKTIKESPIRRL